jgi:hypothetical protein
MRVQHGLRLVYQMTSMTIGLDNDPMGPICRQCDIERASS